MMSQTIFGKWKTVDDETGEEKSIVEIYQDNGKVYGKIIEIFDPTKRDLPCKSCTGEDYNKPVLGLNIIKDMEKSGDVYKKGTVTNPEDGKIYDCRIKLDDNNPNKLQLRGYVAFFYRTQYWIRED
ncbi:DUF2147 domain-containing protein [Psychroserpens damuponensis]|uniref:DUF2147 domain-containing protein n=1 Tax=Psychroserpens damuponensis TaxID=943936 RepID=UPI001F4CDCC9|nr:DUF2147 domain-containing protein [Psychroserpens damuponensis]